MTEFKIGDRVRAKIDGKSWQNCRVIGEDVIDGMRFVSVRDLDQCATGGFFHEKLERLTDADDSKPVAEQDRFRVGDVVRGSDGRFWVVDEKMGVCGTPVAGSLCELAYRAADEAMRVFEGQHGPETVDEVCYVVNDKVLRTSCVGASGSAMRSLFDKGRLHPESALRWLKRQESGALDGEPLILWGSVPNDMVIGSDHKRSNGPQLVQEDPSKRPEHDAWSRHVSEFWAREEEKILKSISIPALAGKSLRDFWVREASGLAIGAPSVPSAPIGPLLKRTKSTHCARCGDPFPLDDRNESVCRFGGEWYHHQCATVVAARLEEERKAKLARVGPDPYKRVKGKDICAGVDNVRGMTAMQIVGEEQRRAENAALFGRRVPERFTADKVPERKAVAHPWECDEGEP